MYYHEENKLTPSMGGYKSQLISGAALQIKLTVDLSGCEKV